MLKTCFNTGWILGQSVSPLSVLLGGTPPAPPQEITLPHDAMVFTDRSPEYPTAGSAYFKPEDYQYTKNVFIPAEDEGKIIYLEFEGVYMNAFVWVNGNLVKKHIYGYTGFYVKINDYLKYGKDNEITVFVKNTAQPNARWYSGAGIYRNVKLLIGDPLHIKTDGVKISTPSIEPDLAAIDVATEVVFEGIGHKTGHVVTEVRDANGIVVAIDRAKFNILSSECITIRQHIYLKKPQRWDLDHPYLYTCASKITVGDATIDEDINTFGVRSLQLDPIKGLRVNGRTVKLKGGCIHHDNGIVGAATFEDAEYRRAKKLKAAGYNALRSAHNPISKAMLDACDKLGIFIMDEFSDVWTKTKSNFDYGFSFEEFWEQDVESMVAKDFNHPSVILYSIGNEISEVGTDIGARWGRKIAEKVRDLDKTRYVTNAINSLVAIMDNLQETLKAMGLDKELGDRAEVGDINQTMTAMKKIMAQVVTRPEVNDSIAESCDLLDVIGYNYAANKYESDLEINPNRIVFGSETNPPALDVNWALVEKYSHVIGDFCWTAWEYLGEVGIGHIGYEDDKNPSYYGAYPWIAAYCSDFDMIGHRRPISYWREIIWGGRNHVPYIAVQRPERYGQETLRSSNQAWTDSLGSWTWPGYEGKNAVVEVYSDAEELELFINGKSQGKKPVGNDYKQFYTTWDTFYESGTVEAVAYIGGNEVGRYSIKTAGAPTLQVTKESDSIRAGTNDLCFVSIELADKEGILNTAAKKRVTISIEGPATIQGSGSANPRTEEHYYELTHDTFWGRMMVVVRAGIEKGIARLTIATDDLEPVTIEIPVL